MRLGHCEKNVRKSVKLYSFSGKRMWKIRFMRYIPRRENLFKYLRFGQKNFIISASLANTCQECETVGKENNLRKILR